MDRVDKFKLGSSMDSPRAGVCQIFDRCITRVSIASAVISAVMILVVIGMITWMVLVRNLDIQTRGLLEVSIEVMVIAIFLAAPYTLHTNGHVRMELLESALPAKLSAIVAMSARLCGLAACVYLSWAGFELALEAYISGERGLGGMQPLLWPKYGAMGLGMGLTSLQYIAQIIRVPDSQLQQQEDGTSDG